MIEAETTESILWRWEEGVSNLLFQGLYVLGLRPREDGRFDVEREDGQSFVVGPEDLEVESLAETRRREASGSV